MKKRIVTISVVFALLFIVVSACFAKVIVDEKNQDDNGDSIVLLNEISNLEAEGRHEEAKAKIATLQDELRSDRNTADGNIWTTPVKMCATLALIGVVYVVVVFAYVYCSILKPFDKMKAFASEVARGNLDTELRYERSNYFGAFTWAFDSMRTELKKARALEREATLNNKTVIATLSHDIKTPIASIGAYVEALEANMDNTPEKRQKYLEVISRKCDEVTKYTNDLFLHSLSDLAMLQVKTEKASVDKILGEIVDAEGYKSSTGAGVAGAVSKIRFDCKAKDVYCDIDVNRFTQIIENVINNAHKYARTDVDIVLEVEEKSKEDATLGKVAVITIRDYGKGIPDEDIPFIFDKFYRGKNCENNAGSGLGLYIVKYLAEQMRGKVSLMNKKDPSGLQICLKFPVVE